jgi:hypothetical protein
MHDTTAAATDEDILHEDSLYDDIAERSRHLFTLKSLAREINAPFENIAEVYEHLLMQ